MIFCFAAALFSQASWCASIDSKYVQLAQDRFISGTTPIVVLSTNVYVDPADRIKPKTLITSDGRYFPNSPGLASMTIRVNGATGVASDSTIDWSASSSSNPQQHSFNTIGLVTLQAGNNLIELIASNGGASPGSFYVGAGSNLSVMTNPAPTSVQSVLNADGPHIDVNTYHPPSLVLGDGANKPFVDVLSHSVANTTNSQAKVISLGSGRAYVSCSSNDTQTPPFITYGEGDASWIIRSGTSQCVNIDSGTQATNDLWHGAEKHAPFYLHAYDTIAANSSKQFNLAMGELAFDTSENGVCYRAGSNTRLITLSGMSMAGVVASASQNCASYNYQCISSTSGSPCLPTGTPVTVAQTTITVPPGHNGIIYFTAKAPIQGDPSDGGGTTFLAINIDGVDRGSYGVQVLASPDSVSRRVLTASYLSASGPNSAPLAPGTHTIKAVMSAVGNFKHVSTTKDAILAYFD